MKWIDRIIKISVVLGILVVISRIARWIIKELVILSIVLIVFLIIVSLL